MDITLRKLKNEEFTLLYQLMQQSFPPSEFRSFEGELSLFQYTNYQVLVAESDGMIQAFIAEWRFDTFHYVEHFAVNPNMRGKGFGSSILRTYLSKTTLPVVIEVEAADTIETKRRIAFYERLSFKLSDIEYTQPRLQHSSHDVLLRLMVYPTKVMRDELLLMKECIFNGVYHKNKNLIDFDQTII
jgi:GNAT superfamily N-acetyltransferase